MLSLFSKIVLFGLSYSPLLIVIAIENYPCWKPAVLAAGVICLFSYFTWQILQKVKQFNTYPLRIDDVKIDNHDAVTNYLFIYVIPLLGLDFSNAKNIAVVIFLVILIGYLYIKNDMIYINPVLNILFGYNIYLISSESRKVILLSRRKNADMNRIHYCNAFMIADNLYLEEHQMVN